MKALTTIAEELKKLNHNLLQFLNMQGHEIKDCVDDVLGGFNAYTRNNVTKEEFIKILKDCEAYEPQPDGRELVSITNIPCVFGYYVNYVAEKDGKRMQELFGDGGFDTRAKKEMPDECPLTFKKDAATVDLNNTLKKLNNRFKANVPYNAMVQLVKDAKIQTITVGHNRHFRKSDAGKVYKIFKLLAK